MKKKVNVIFILLLALCLLTLVACQPKDADGLIKLKAPKGLALSGSALSWDEVEHAERYFITVKNEAGDEMEGETTSTTYDISTLVIGYYGNFDVAVRAYGDGEKYGTSDRSETIVYHKGDSLDKPEVEVNSVAMTVSWKSVPNAVEYAVSIYNGKEEVLINKEITTQTEFSFADRKDSEGKDLFEGFDKYRITVTAKPAKDSEKFSDSLPGIKYYIKSTTLSAPAFNALSSTRISWNKIDNAKSYILKMTYKGSDGTIKEETKETTYDYYLRSNFTYAEVGEYTFSIMAKGDGEVFYDSAWGDKTTDGKECKVTKLQYVDEKDMSLVYDKDGKATLTWSMDADPSVNQFTLSLKATLPNGERQLDSISMNVSCKVVNVKGKVYDVYKYVDSSKNSVEKIDGSSMVVYNFNGELKVRYNNKDYNVQKDDKDMSYSVFYTTEDGIDIAYDAANDKFEYDKNIKLADGSKAKQATDDEEELFKQNGDRLCYFEKGTSDADKDVVKDFEYGEDHEPSKYVFSINLDTIFITEVKTEEGEGDNKVEKTTLKYERSDSYYGILYNISVLAGNSSSDYVASAESFTKGKYLSYKIPSKHVSGSGSDEESYYQIRNAGEYAYIVLKNYIDVQNNDTNVKNNYVIEENINFNGYEITQIDTLKDYIDGNEKTLSNIVVGNSQLTKNGVVEIYDTEDGKIKKHYAMFLNIGANAEIEDAFYMGIGFVGYNKDSLGENVIETVVAPIAIRNDGILDRIFVQSDKIEADGAYLSGMVMLNNGAIRDSQVYADLIGRNVAGIAIINGDGSNAVISGSGFYGSINAKMGELVESDAQIAGAGLVITNNDTIRECEAVGSVNVDASGLEAGYAGGLVAINDGVIDKSYSGQYYRSQNNANRTVVYATGDNSYAGGFVAINGGTITNSYATNRATANLYAGGFVGLNSGSIESAYAVGGTGRGGNNNGAFAGSDEGTITKASAYADPADFWLKEEDYFELINNEDKLGDMVGILYSGENRYMTTTEKEGFRYPILTGRVYTKNYFVEMSRDEIPDVKGIIVIDGEVKDLTIKSEDICGDSSKSGKVVIVIKYQRESGGPVYTKMVYGKVR